MRLTGSSALAGSRLRNGITHSMRRAIVRPSASGGNQKKPEDDKKKRETQKGGGMGFGSLQKTLKLSDKYALFLAIAVGGGALSGSVAIGIASSINAALNISGRPFNLIDPIGNFHLDYAVLPYAILASLPIIFLDAAVMLPDWKTIREKHGFDDSKKLLNYAADRNAEATAAKKSGGKNEEENSGEAKSSEKEVGGSGTDEPSMRLASSLSSSTSGKDRETTKEEAPEFALSFADMSALLIDATKLRKDQLTGNNPGRLFTATEEGALVVFNAFGESMKRAVFIQAMSGWIADRYFEAGLDEPAGWPLGWLSARGADTIAEESRYTALGIIVGAFVMSIVLRIVTSGTRGLAIARMGPEGVVPGPGDALGRALAKKVSTQMQLLTAISGLRRVLDIGMSLGAYVVTGNLLAAVATESLSEGLMCLWQRRAVKGVEQERQEKMNKIREAMKKMQSARGAIEMRKALGEPTLSESDMAELEKIASTRSLAAIADAVKRIKTIAERYAGRLQSLQKQLEQHRRAAADSMDTVAAISRVIGPLPPRAASPGPSFDPPIVIKSESDAPTTSESGSTETREKESKESELKALGLIAKVIDPALLDLQKTVHALRGVLSTTQESVAYILSPESEFDLLDRGEAQKTKADIAPVFESLNATHAKIQEIRDQLAPALAAATDRDKSGGDSGDNPEKLTDLALSR